MPSTSRSSTGVNGDQEQRLIQEGLLGNQPRRAAARGGLPRLVTSGGHGLPSDGAQAPAGLRDTHEHLAGAEDDVFVLNVQAPLPPGVALMVRAEAANDSHRDEANKVLDSIKLFLDRHPIRYRCEWVVGSPSVRISRSSRAMKPQSPCGVGMRCRCALPVWDNPQRTTAPGGLDQSVNDAKALVAWSRSRCP